MVPSVTSWSQNFWNQGELEATYQKSYRCFKSPRVFGTSLVVQWRRLQCRDADMGSISGLGTKISYCCCLVAQSCLTLFVIPWTVAHQAPLSIEFPRQEYWSGLPCPPPGVLPHSGIEPVSPALAGRSLTAELLGEP